ncbi:MAG: hypothetical protein J6P62_04895, partial [Bacteroidales bacterium]|nr:hypothetical protein [Bacteroidales bacterium]
MLEAPIINPKPPREVERDPIPIPPQEEVVHTEPEPTGRVPDVEETRPTPTPSRPTGKPSPSPGTGSRPAAQNPPVAEEPVIERPASSLNADDYTAVLDVTETMELHQKGDLRVWIGKENYIQEEEPDMIRGMTTFPGDEGNYARITPYAPDFRIEPDESQTMRISPSGSSILFTIIPQKKGEFRISAKIELFDNPYFDGVPIPKTTNIVSVVVTVDPKVNLMARLGQLGTVLWDNFLKFWGAVVALIFGALFFVTRKFIKKKTGFTGNGIESSSLSGGSESAPSEGKEMPEEAGSESGEEEGETEVGE